MIHASLHRVLVAAVAVAISSPAGAQENTGTSPPAEPPVTTSIATFILHDGYQVSNHDALDGFSQTVVLGFRLGNKEAGFQRFFEAGISRLATDDSPLVTSSALIGARLAWRWKRLALHVFGRFHHGEAIEGDDAVAIYSYSMSLGVMGSVDLLRRGGQSMALAVHAIGQLHDASDGEEATLVGAGGGGLSLVLW
jgi:hypothetical protein